MDSYNHGYRVRATEGPVQCLRDSQLSTEKAFVTSTIPSSDSPTAMLFYKLAGIERQSSTRAVYDSRCPSLTFLLQTNSSWISRIEPAPSILRHLRSKIMHHIWQAAHRLEHQPCLRCKVQYVVPTKETRVCRYLCHPLCEGFNLTWTRAVSEVERSAMGNYLDGGGIDAET
jgi:hypothetical protein